MHKFSLLGLFAAVLLCLSGCDSPEERRDKALTILSNITTAADFDKLFVAETEKLTVFMAAERKKKEKGEPLTGYFDALTLFAPAAIALSFDPEILKKDGVWDDWSRGATEIQWKRALSSGTPEEQASLKKHRAEWGVQFADFWGWYNPPEKDAPKEKAKKR